MAEQNKWVKVKSNCVSSLHDDVLLATHWNCPFPNAPPIAAGATGSGRFVPGFGNPRLGIRTSGCLGASRDGTFAKTRTPSNDDHDLSSRRHRPSGRHVDRLPRCGGNACNFQVQRLGAFVDSFRCRKTWAISHQRVRIRKRSSVRRNGCQGGLCFQRSLHPPVRSVRRGNLQLVAKSALANNSCGLRV